MKHIWPTGGTILTGYMKMESCSLLIEDGKIGEVINDRRFASRLLNPEDAVLRLNGAYVSPGFIDTHIHGFGGFGVEDGSVDSILGMSRELARQGVTGFCPTVYTDSQEAMEKALSVCRAAMGHERGARILGIHPEGPFISPKRAGAQWR